jgi:LysR family transcriptional regulator for metE and metH
MRLVRTLAAEGTLTRAGKKLFLSQSALSHQLREIENELGGPLFRRLNKRMVLTDAGRRVLAGAGVILGELGRVRDDVLRITTGEAGSLRLAASSHASYHWLPAVLRQFRDRFPGVDVGIDSSATADPAGFVLRGDVDLAIENIRVSAPGLRHQKLFDDEMFALVPGDHPWVGRSHVTAAMFAAEQLVNYDHDIEDVVFYRRVLAPAGVKPKSLIKVPVTEAIIELVRAGMGVAVLSRWSIGPYIEAPDLATVRVTKNGFRRVWYAVTARDRYLPPFVAGFVEIVTRHVARTRRSARRS